MLSDMDKIKQLEIKFQALSSRHKVFLEDINALKVEIERIKLSNKVDISQNETVEKRNPISVADYEVSISVRSGKDGIVDEIKNSRIKKEDKSVLPKVNFDLEKFIGENLINKIGIIITVIGVAIGAKYSIEHELISPLTRIILGYVAGVGLLGFGIKLKAKYESYSAVLVSGAIAIMYFITFSAHAFYGLIPQALAFALMVVFTTFTVVAALSYNRQVIAHIGLVGAYAIPFLLSDGSGNITVLFIYMAIINIGILVISFKKYWKPLYYVSFGLTWLVYASWYASKFNMNDHFNLALAFGSIFYLTFYVAFLAYKLIRKEIFKKSDIVLLMLNSFIFYGLGFVILNEHEFGSKLLGLFTVANALVHFVVSTIIHRLKLGERNLFYLVMGLVLVYITIAIPVQLDGNWVTLIWVGESAILFWIGRTKKVLVYEKLSYPLMLLALASIMQDWTLGYGHYNPANIESRITPILNVYFLTSVLFLAAFGFINFINRIKPNEQSVFKSSLWSSVFSLGVPGIFLFALFYGPYLEIINYWEQLYKDSYLSINLEDNYHTYRNYDLLSFKKLGVIFYSLVFFSGLSFVNILKLKSQKLGFVNLVFNSLAIVFFLMSGLLALSHLRESYLEQSLAEYYNRGIFNLVIRYVSYGFLAVLLLSCYKLVKQAFLKINLRTAFDMVFHITILWVGSSELINWMDIANSAQSYKLGLSILWGSYALLAISLGIWKHKKHLRIGGFVLFGITLLKLFFYDISHLDTISKTIVFVSLGVLLLIISFIYNKYKQYITDEKID